MSNNNWQVGETYKTVGGWKGRVISLDGPKAYPIVSVQVKSDGVEILKTHTSNGYVVSGARGPSDLIPPRREIFVVYDSNGDSFAKTITKEFAFKCAKCLNGKIKVIRFVEDGEVKDE